MSTASFWDRTRAWGSTVAEKATEAAHKAVDKTKEVAVKTKEQVKHRLGKTETVIEMQNILEQKAKNCNSITEIADLHRSWVSAMNRKDGALYLLYDLDESTNAEKEQQADASGHSGTEQDMQVAEVESTGGGANANNNNDVINSKGSTLGRLFKSRRNEELPPGARYLNFKQVLLRSRAIELSLEQIFKNDSLRGRFPQPQPEDHSSQSFYLYSVLQNAMSSPSELWASLLQTATKAEMLSEFHIKWLSEMYTLLKVDWQDEVYHADRKDMAVRAEQLRNEIRSVKTSLPSLSDAEIERQHKTKVMASRELVALYKSLRQNMEEALVHREKVLAKRDDSVKTVVNQMEDYKLSLTDGQKSSLEIREKLEKEMEDASKVLKNDLETFESERLSIDQEVEELELRKNNLRLEMEAVTQKLVIAREKQKNFMVEQDRKRNSMYSEKANFKSQIEQKRDLVAQCKVNRAVLLQIQQLVEVTDKTMAQSLQKQISELGKKRDQFQHHFVDVLRDHCRYEEDRLISIGEICKVSCGKLIKLHDGEDDALQREEEARGGGAQMTRVEFLARERHVFTKATHDLELVWTDIVNFKRAHDDFIKTSNILSDALARMDSKYRLIKQHIAPGLELLLAVNDTPSGAFSGQMFSSEKNQSASQPPAVSQQPPPPAGQQQSPAPVAPSPPPVVKQEPKAEASAPAAVPKEEPKVESPKMEAEPESPKVAKEVSPKQEEVPAPPAESKTEEAPKAVETVDNLI